ncbi:MAG: FHA domain-containing protein [Candidatus Promineifilaceae bacterium]
MSTNIVSLLILFVCLALWLVPATLIYQRTRQCTGVERLIWTVTGFFPLVGPLLYMIMQDTPVALETDRSVRFQRQPTRPLQRPRIVQDAPATLSAESAASNVQTVVSRIEQRKTRVPNSAWNVMSVAGDGRIQGNGKLRFGRVLLGALPAENTIVIDGDETVSGKHIRLEVDENEVILTNLSHGSFTWVNNQRLSPDQEQPLTSGSHVRIGNTVLSVTKGGAIQPHMPAVRQTQRPNIDGPLISISLAETAEYQLRVEEGADQGQRFPLMALPARIGRDAACHVCLHGDESVSRTHASIVRRHGSLWIRDENSSRGTSVNGYDVEEKRIKKGDRIRLGDTLLVVEKAK